MEVPPWMSLGEFSDVSAQPVAGVAVSRGRNLYDIFSVGKDGALYSKSWSGLRWTPPLDGHVRYLKLGEGCVGAPAAVARHRDRIDVFVLDSDGKLLHKTWDGQEWNPPDLIFEVLGSPPGVSFGSQPALVARGSERFDLFIIGKNGNLYHKALGKSIWNPASGFRDLGGNFEPSFPPTVVLRGESMEIFLVGGKETERGGYHKSWNGVVDPSLSEYEPLGIWNCSGPIAAVVRNVEPHVE